MIRWGMISSLRQWNYFGEIMNKNNLSSPIQAVVNIKQSGLRSINMERDLGNDTIAEGYVLTAQVRASVGRILNSFDSSTPTRSWTLTGPYGSGKSFFGL